MKTIEEKAKAYDKVRKKIAIRFGSNVADEFFAEFEESEDEKVRKEIINYFQCQSEEEPTRKEIHNKWIAWLENIPYTIDHEKREGFHLGYKACLEEQSEQKPIEENKGNIGGISANWSEEDEMVRKDLIGFFKDEAFLCHKKKQIIAWLKKQGDSPIKWNKNTKDCKPQKNHSVLMKTTHGIAEGEWQGEKWFQYRWSSSIKDSDILFWIELSDIEKQGETFPVLSNSSNSRKNEQKTVCSEEELQLKEGKYYECIKSYYYLGGGQYWFDKGKVYFCEKDGYLRSDPNNLIKVYDCKNWQSYFRPYTENPAWSEEDEVKINRIVACLKNLNVADNDILLKDIDWLKSLQDRVQPQPKQEWKQENTGDLTAFENAMMHIGGSFFGQHAGLDPNDTNSIKEQANLLLELVPSKEWSEEDERMIKEIISDVKFEGYNNDMQADSYKKINWLKSLRPQNKWKPSDEQIDALTETVHNLWGSPETTLSGLLADLKKLKEGKV